MKKDFGSTTNKAIAEARERAREEGEYREFDEHTKWLIKTFSHIDHAPLDEYFKEMFDRSRFGKLLIRYCEDHAKDSASFVFGAVVRMPLVQGELSPVVKEFLMWALTHVASELDTNILHLKQLCHHLGTAAHPVFREALASDECYSWAREWLPKLLSRSE